MEIIIRNAGQILANKAGRIFASRCGISYPVEFDFENKIIKIFAFPDLKAAGRLCKEKYYYMLEECLWWQQERVEIYYPNCIKPIFIKERFMSDTPQIVTPAFFASAGWVSKPLLDCFERLLRDPNKKLGVSRVSDRKQIYVTQAAAQAVKSSADRAASRSVTDYLYLPDLEEIDRTLNQQGTQSGGITLQYRATLNNTLALDPEAEWGYFTTQTFVFVDDFGMAYRESEILDIKAVAKPQFVLTR